MKILRSLINIILVLLCLASTTFLSMTTIINKRLSTDTLKNVIMDYDMTFILEHLNDKDKEVLGTVEEIFTLVGIPDKAIDDVLNSKATKEFIALYASNVATYLFTGEDIAIEAQDIKDLLANNMDVLRESLSSDGQKVFDLLKELIIIYLDRNGEDLAKSFPKPSAILEEIDKSGEAKDIYMVVDALNLLTSTKTRNITLGIITITIILLIILNLKQRHWAKLGIIISMLYLLTMTIIEIALAFITEYYKGEEFSSILSYITNLLEHDIWYFVFVGFLINIAMNIIHMTRNRETTS